jgi:lysozyme
LALRRFLVQTILGTDVSKWQGPSLDWPAVAAMGVRFAFCKATEHVGYVDPTFARNIGASAKAGLITGSYHMLRPEADVQRQAEHYFRVADGRGPLPPVLDFELTGGLKGAEVLRRGLAFVEATEALWGRPCIVYTGNWFWRAIGDPAAPHFAHRPLWVAHYGVKAPAIPKPWRERGWTIWQFDGDGGRRLPGVDGDFNHFAGTEADLRALCAQTAVACLA